MDGVSLVTLTSDLCVQDESGTADSSGLDDSSQDRFIGPLPRDGTVGCSSEYSSPSYSYSSILNKSETGKPCHVLPTSSFTKQYSWE